MYNENINNKLVFWSLIILFLGSYVSMTLSALHHILIVPPIIYFLVKDKIKITKKSQWALLGLILVFILSIFVNQDIAVKGFKPLSKIKYYIIGFLSVYPLQRWWNNLNKDEHEKAMKYCVQAIVYSLTIASLYGMLRVFYNFNPLNLSYSDATRNTGFFGMVLNFAHNLAMGEVFLIALLIHRKRSKNWIDYRILILAILINFISLYTTYSRGAILAGFVGIPFIFFLNNTKKFFLAGFLGILILAGAQSTTKYKIDRVGSDHERLSQWKTAWVGFQERPLTGLGYLNFEQMCPKLKIKYDIDQKQFCGHAHNNFLEILADSGIFGFISFTLWIFFWIIELIKKNNFQAQLIIPLIAVFLVSGLTQATFTLGANLFLIMALYAFSIVEVKE